MMLAPEIIGNALQVAIHEFDPRILELGKYHEHKGLFVCFISK